MLAVMYCYQDLKTLINLFLLQASLFHRISVGIFTKKHIGDGYLFFLSSISKMDARQIKFHTIVQVAF
jgi:hypothetical protein